MELYPLDLLTIFRVFLLCAAVPGAILGLRRLYRAVACYRQLPSFIRRLVRGGVLTSVLIVIREDWPKLLGLMALVCMLIGISILSWMI